MEIKDIKSLDKSKFYIVTVPESYDVKTLSEIDKGLNSQGINCLVIPESINFYEVKTLKAEALKAKLQELISLL